MYQMTTIIDYIAHSIIFLNKNKKKTTKERKEEREDSCTSSLCRTGQRIMIVLWRLCICALTTLLRLLLLLLLLLLRLPPVNIGLVARERNSELLHWMKEKAHRNRTVRIVSFSHRHNLLACEHRRLIIVGLFLSLKNASIFSRIFWVDRERANSKCRRMSICVYELGTHCIRKGFMQSTRTRGYLFLNFNRLLSSAIETILLADWRSKLEAVEQQHVRISPVRLIFFIFFLVLYDSYVYAYRINTSHSIDFTCLLKKNFDQ